MNTIHERLDGYGRDVIRKAARLAGVINTSYKSKADNISAMIDLGVVDVTEAGEPVFTMQVVHDQAQAERERRAVREAFDAARDDGSDVLDDIEVPAGVGTLADHFVPDATVGLTAQNDGTEVSYSLSMDANGNSVLTLVVDDELHVVDSKSLLYTRLVTALLAGDDVRPFLSTDEEVVLDWATSHLNSRVRIEHARDGEGEAHSRLFIDDTEVHGKVVEQFKRYWLQGRDPQNLLRFLEKVADNPLDVAEVGLYNWGSALTINEAGNFVGFKAVLPVRDVETDEILGYRPSNRGPGAVNGVEVDPDEFMVFNVGDEVTIDRDLVRPGGECGVGLHVGTWNYARDFLSYQGGIVMEVEVNPADIVNVPRSETGKLRCCRFHILGFHDANGVLEHHEPEATFDEDAAVAAVEDVFEDERAVGFFRRIFGRKAGR